MKKFIVIAIFIAGLVSGLSAIDGYNNIDNQNNGSKTYISTNGNIAVIEALTFKSKITFGTGDEGDINTNNHRTFERISIVEHYNIHDYGDLYMVINGQFFGWSKYTPLSFNVKKYGDLLQDKVLEPEKGKRLLCILKGKYPIFYKGTIEYEYGKQINKTDIQKEILSLLENKNITDGITGFDPFDINAQKAIGAQYSKGRNMIGCIPFSKYDLGSIAICKKVYFFISKSISQKSLISEMKKWGIEEEYMLTLDGSGSAQAYTEEFQYNGKNFRMPGDYRKIPNSILIYSK